MAEQSIAPVSDPSLVVRHRRGGDSWRVHPGTYDDPLAAIDSIEGFGEIDDALVSRVGYGFTDLVDIALAAMDDQLRALSPAWGGPAPETPDASVELSEAEVAAAVGLIWGGAADLSAELPWLERCRNPARCRIALRVGVETPHEGASLVVRLGSRPVVAPAGFVIPSLVAAASLHLEELIEGRPDGADLLRRVARRELAGWLLDQPVIIECPDPERDPLVAHFGERHAISFDPDGPRPETRTPSAVPVVVTAASQAPYSPIDPPEIGIAELKRIARRASIHQLEPFFKALSEQRPLPQARSVADLHAAWVMAGTLDPEIVGGYVATAADGEWQEAATWDPADDVLATLGLPPSRRWASRTAEDGRTLEYTLHRAYPPGLAFVCTNPRLVVEADSTPACPDLRLQITLAYTLLLRAQEPGLRELVELVGGGRGVILRLALVADASPPESEAEDIFFGAGVLGLPADEDHPAIMSLVFDSTLLTAHAIDADRAHRAVGELLLSAATECVDLPAGCAAAFRAEWSLRWPMIVSAMHTTVGSRAPLPAPLTERSVDLPARIAGAAARRMGVPDGALQGADAVDFAVKVYCPALVEEARSRIAGFDRPALMRFTAFQLEQVLHARWRLEGAALLAHHAPWENDIGAADLADAGRDIRAVQLLMELTATTKSEAGPAADHVDWIELASLADAALFAAVAADYTRLGIGDLTAMAAGGRAAVWNARGQGVDLAAYQHARGMHRRRPGRWNPTEQTREAIESGAGPNEFVSIDDGEVPAIWRSIDDALRVATGAGIDDIVAVFGTAGVWDVTTGEPASLVERQHLVEEAVGWSGRPLEGVSAAVDLLTFDAGRAAAAPPDYWRLEERPQRLASRPLVAEGDERLWIMPGAVRSAQLLFVSYLDDGRLLWPDLPDTAYQPVRKLRASMDRQLEERTTKVCQELGFKIWPNLKPKKARALGAHWSDSVGEFDVLAADEDRARLWVLEAKNPVDAVSGWHLRDAVADFHEPGGHIDKLERRLGVVASDPDVAARVLGAEGGGWTVCGAMVTSQVEVAAFTSNPRVTFVVVDDLLDLLTAEAIIPPGHWRVGLV